MSTTVRTETDAVSPKCVKLHEIFLSLRTKRLLTMPACVVVGGSGFLGHALVKRLVSNKAKWERVVVFDIKKTIQDDTLRTAVFHQGYFTVKCNENSVSQLVDSDIRRQDDLVTAFKEAQVVFHCATAAPSAENAKNKVC